MVAEESKFGPEIVQRQRNKQDFAFYSDIDFGAVQLGFAYEYQTQFDSPFSMLSLMKQIIGESIYFVSGGPG